MIRPSSCALPGPGPGAGQLGTWLSQAREAGLGPDDIDAIDRTAMRELVADAVA